MRTFIWMGLCKMGGIPYVALGVMCWCKVPGPIVRACSFNAHTGGLRKGSMEGRRMKELWPSLTTVEPATIYPPGRARGGRKGRRFCGAQKGRNEGRCMRACERTTPHALGMQSSGCGVAEREGGRTAEPIAEKVRALTLCVGNEYSPFHSPY